MGAKYQIGDVWTVKATNWLVKNERVTILKFRGSNRKKEVLVQKKVAPSQQGWISVKKLKKLISRI